MNGIKVRYTQKQNGCAFICRRSENIHFDCHWKAKNFEISEFCEVLHFPFESPVIAANFSSELYAFLFIHEASLNVYRHMRWFFL